MCVSHFTAAFLNTGFGNVPDLTFYILKAKQWFKDGLDEIDFHVTTDA